MKIKDHIAEAERLVDACPDTKDEDLWWEYRQENIFAAQAYALIAIAKLLERSLR